MKIIIDISFIKSGGGAAYVDVFEKLYSAHNCTFISNNVLVRSDVIVWRNLWHREILMNSIVHDLVVNISNVPYLMSRKNVIFFLHQRYYVDKSGLQYLSLGDRLKMVLKRWYFASFARVGYEYVVQTEVMKNLLRSSLGYNAKVNTMLPAFGGVTRVERQPRAVLHNDTVGHKKVDWRHPIFRWLEDNEFSLCIVGSQPPANFRHNYLGYLSMSEMDQLLTESMIYLNFSRFDSLGLPYVEACNYGMALFAIRTDTLDEICEDYYDLHTTDLKTLDAKRLVKPKLKIIKRTE